MSNVKLNAPIINAPTFRLIYCGILKQKLVVLLNSENRQKKRTHCIGMFYVKIFDLKKQRTIGNFCTLYSQPQFDFLKRKSNSWHLSSQCLIGVCRNTSSGSIHPAIVSVPTPDSRVHHPSERIRDGVSEQHRLLT